MKNSGFVLFFLAAFVCCAVSAIADMHEITTKAETPNKIIISGNIEVSSKSIDSYEENETPDNETVHNLQNIDTLTDEISEKITENNQSLISAETANMIENELTNNINVNAADMQDSAEEKEAEKNIMQTETTEKDTENAYEQDAEQKTEIYTDTATTEKNESIPNRLMKVIENILLPKSENISNISNFKFTDRLTENETEAYVFAVEIKPFCNINTNFTEIKSISTDEHLFKVIEIDRNKISEFAANECVIKLADEDGLENFIYYAEDKINNETQKRIREMKLNKTGHDISYEELEKIINESPTPENKISPLQAFVTPDNYAVKTSANGMNKEEIYKKAAGWTWVSDITLNNMPEEWLYPEQFLMETPYMETNPLQESVSDCEEQANTLVSILRTIIPAEQVRVALGEVDFGSGPAGHAWVEVLEDDGWIVLDPTVGPFYDDEKNELIIRDELPYDYWKYHAYPVVKIWAYYNDKYYNGVGITTASVNNAPEKWTMSYKQLFSEDVSNSFMKSAIIPMINWTLIAIVFIAGLVFFIYVMILKAAQRNL